MLQSPHFQKQFRALTRGLGLEEVSDGKTFREREIETYVRISNFQQLEASKSVDRQEQWVLKFEKTDKNAAMGQVRVRKIEPVRPFGEVQYVLTAKMVLGQGDRLEVPVPCSADMFNLIKHGAEMGMVKDRYHFPVEGTALVYEVDMFLLSDGSYAPWAKIDLEGCTGEMPPLPIEVDERIDGRSQDPADKAKIRELYERYFLAGNHFLKAA